MPPKPRYSREEILSTALDMVSENGMEVLTARELANRLGTSTRPIFTAFQNMEEIRTEVRRAAMRRYDSYTQIAVDYTPAFKKFGVQMIRFAREEPKLFQLLFMSAGGEAKTFDQVFVTLGDTAVMCIGLLQNDYALSYEDAMLFFRHIWIHTYGIAALCATGVCTFTEDEINDMLGQDFLAMLMRIKSGDMRAPTVHPVPKDEGVPAKEILRHLP